MPRDIRRFRPNVTRRSGPFRLTVIPSDIYVSDEWAIATYPAANAQTFATLSELLRAAGLREADLEEVPAKSAAARARTTEGDDE